MVTITGSLGFRLPLSMEDFEGFYKGLWLETSPYVGTVICDKYLTWKN